MVKHKICVWPPFADLNPVLMMDFLCESKHKYVNLEELFSRTNKLN